jgi:hypothetical protein
MKRKHIEAARQHARDRMLGQFDWRVLADAEAAATARPVRAAKLELSEVEREILRLHKLGLLQQDLATHFGVDDVTVHALLFGAAGSA